MNIIMLHVGDRVETKKGCRFNGPFRGNIVGFTTWSGFDAAKVKKSNGRVVTCLLQNLRIIRRAR
jgi:hypothetical protein